MSENRLFPPVVLFDWDNTLIDTLPLIIQAHNRVRSTFGMPPWGPEEVLEKMSVATKEGLVAQYGDRWQEADALYSSHIAAHHLDALTPAPGALALLSFLAERRVPAGVVSNKRRLFLQAEVDALGWRRFFFRVVSPEDVQGRGKPSPSGVFAALDAIDLHLSKRPAVWYVGDTETDIRTAQAAGVVSVLIENKYVARNDHAFSPAPEISFSGCSDCLDYLAGFR